MRKIDKNIQTKKTVSVVMCTYNGATNDGKYLRAQLDSILAQTYPISEIIVQDDCSTDDTISILEDYATRYSIIHVFQNEKQKGVDRNFFSAMARAKSDYIMLSDQDDIWLPMKIQQQITTIGDKWLSVHPTVYFYRDNPQIPSPLDITTLLKVPTIQLPMAGAISGHTMMLSLSFVKFLVGHFTEPDLVWWQQQGILHDEIVSISAMLYGQVVYYPYPLDYYRRHPDQYTALKQDQERRGQVESVSLVNRSKRWLCTIGRLCHQLFWGYNGRRSFYQKRFLDYQKLVSLFPDAPAKNVHIANQLINAYLSNRYGIFRVLYVRYYRLIEPYQPVNARGVYRACKHALAW